MSKSRQESLGEVKGVVEVGGSQSSIPIASSYKKIGFQMSNKNAVLLSYLCGGVS
jgi:hypothetical protein